MLDAAAGAVGGKVAHAVTGAAAGVIAPKISQAVQKLGDLGVQMTPGQIAGGGGFAGWRTAQRAFPVSATW
jgi:hypothetical protein